MKPQDIMENADRLLSDARFLYDSGRSRSAATLIVVALEQFGAFVDVLIKERYPDAETVMGIFGRRASKHAHRQDALAAHVLNHVLGKMVHGFTEELFDESGEPDFTVWASKVSSLSFTPEQQARMRADKELKTANILMHFVRQNRLKDLREFGLYADTEEKFSPDAVLQVIELAEKVKIILNESQHRVAPEPIQLAGVNLPDRLILGQD